MSGFPGILCNLKKSGTNTQMKSGCFESKKVTALSAVFGDCPDAPLMTLKGLET